MSRMVEYDYLLDRAKTHPTTKNNTIFFLSLKTVDAVPVVHGNWVWENGWMPPKCSNCKLPPKTPGYIGDDDFYAANYKRCPNCGANMDAPDTDVGKKKEELDGE